MGLSQAFFTHYRTNIAYPFDRHNEDTYPVFADLAAWGLRPGAKLQKLIDLLRHLLSHDEIEIPNFQKDDPWPSPPPVPDGQQPPRKRKIIVSHEFAMMAHTLKSVSGDRFSPACRFTDYTNSGIGSPRHRGRLHQRHHDCRATSAGGP